MRVREWRHWVADAPLADASTLLGRGGLMVIAPHPDDESLGAASLLASAAAANRPICLVALTDGDASHPASSKVAPAELAVIRAGEQAAAMDALGCGDATIIRLGWPDGSGGAGQDIAAAAARLRELADRMGVTTLAASAPTDAHPDHAAAAALAAAMHGRAPHLRRLSYEVWTASRPDDDDLDVRGMTPFRLDAGGGVLALKRAAIACHRSQFGELVLDDPDGFVLPGWFLNYHLSGRELVFWHDMPGQLPGPEHFSQLYAGQNDPWGAASRPYEIDKRAHAFEALGHRRFERAVEAGCGEGYFAAMLADLSASVLGLDAEPAIIARARARHAGRPGLAFEVARLPDGLPDGAFDLMVLSEILYFLDEPQLTRLAARIRQSMPVGSRVLMVHYLGQTDTPLSGEDAVDFLIASLEGWLPETAERRPGYRLDMLRRAA